jgi:hypothetical protein
MRRRVGLTEKDANLCLQIRAGTTPLAAMCLAAKSIPVRYLTDVRFGALADIRERLGPVRFMPNNGRWAAHPSKHLAVGL